MTAPSKINGVSAKVLHDYRASRAESVVRSCINKVRYADEHAARAVGCRAMITNPAQVQLFIYKCRHCRGWHLTKCERPPYFAVDYLEKGAYK